MVDVHEMVLADRQGSGSLFECTVDGCGRQVLLHRGGGRTVLLRGDELAPHRALPGLTLRGVAGPT
jgi:hypothetical protein